MATNSSLFRDFLAEGFENRVQKLDVVGMKRKRFESLLNIAHDALRKKHMTAAKHSYFNVIDFLRNEPYHDELTVSLDLQYDIKCCFCYSSILDPLFCQEEKTVINTLTENSIKILQEEYADRLFPKYLNVLLSFKKKDWAMTLYWCNMVSTFKEKLGYYKPVDFFIELLPSQSEIKSAVGMCEEKAFYGYGQKLTSSLWCKQKTDQVKANKDSGLLSECDHCMKVKIQRFILNGQPVMDDTKLKFEGILNKFVELYQKISETNFTNCSEADLLDKIEEIGNLVTNDEKTKKKLKLSVGQTQTDKIKNGNRSVQTEGVKCKNAEVQANLESQTLSALLDLKNKLLQHLEKKDSINRMNKKIDELNEKVTKETNKSKSAEEGLQMKLEKKECEISILKNLLNQCDIERRQEREKNISLQKLLLEQTNDKFNLLKNMCKTFEKKSLFMVSYLREIHNYLTPSSIPSDAVIKQNIDIWDRHLSKAQENLNHLNIFYSNIRVDMIKSDRFNVIWPDMPEFPVDEDNIIFVSFKPAIKNMIGLEANLRNNSKITIPNQPQQGSPMLPNVPYNVQQAQYSVQNRSFTGHRNIHPTAPPSNNVPPTKLPQRRSFQQNHMEQNPNLYTPSPIGSTEFINKTSDPYTENAENPNRINTSAMSSNSSSDRKNEMIPKREAVFLDYVVARCSGATEIDVTLAMLQVMNDNGGTLSKLSKEQIVAEVKAYLRMKRQSVWATPKPPYIDWKNDHSEHSCSICFEEFSPGTTYTLQCQHEYHKECIKRWLKTSSICPICRVHTVIDDDFPPLH